MKLIAKNSKQLGICLKILYAEGVTEFPIDTHMGENGKLYFNVVFSVEEECFNRIKARYEILISK